jgi:hypothetical protein
LIPLTVIGIVVLFTVSFRQSWPCPSRACRPVEPERPVVAEVKLEDIALPPRVAVRTGGFAQKARAAACFAFVVPCGTVALIAS